MSATATRVRESQLLMKAPMVLATLGGWKSQTRRVMAVQPSGPTVVRDLWEDWPGGPAERPESSWRAFWRAESTERPGEFVDHSLRSPYGGPGDRLWVRETWVEAETFGLDGDDPAVAVHYRADDRVSAPLPVDDATWVAAAERIERYEEEGTRWRPGIHMPRWASRITLDVTELRVQRIQSISDADARAEGIAAATKDGRLWKYGLADADGLPGGAGWPWYEWETSPRTAFRRLWDEINAPRGVGWDVNPWVWVISFRRVEVTP